VLLVRAALGTIASDPAAKINTQPEQNSASMDEELVVLHRVQPSDCQQNSVVAEGWASYDCFRRIHSEPAHHNFRSWNLGIPFQDVAAIKIGPFHAEFVVAFGCALEQTKP